MTDMQKTKLVGLARSLVGKPYKYGATTEEAPDYFDCSSFIQYLFGQIGIELLRSSILQAAAPQGKEIALAHDFSNLETGDLLFARGVIGHYRDELFDEREMYIGHVALYIGDGRIIHTREKLGSIREQLLTEMLAEPKYTIVLVKRF